MTPGEFREYAKTMREYGIKTLNLNGAVIELFHVEQLTQTAQAQSVALSPHSPVSTDAKKPHSELLGGTPNQDPDPVQHRIEQVASLMRLNDMELVDQLFPEPKEDTEVVA